MTDLDAFLDALETTAGAHGYKVITAAELSVMIREARAKLDTEPSEPATPEHWSPWLDWNGGPCPLPSGVQTNTISLGGFNNTRSTDVNRQWWEWSPDILAPRKSGEIIRFRYLADNPAGWLPRGDWIPPAGLWRDDCPVRCEWRAADAGGVQSAGSCQPRNWHTITHIRLVARERAEATQSEPVPELPEWLRWDDGEWCITGRDGYDSYYRFPTDSDDLDRIAEACTKLAARERARRAGS